MENNEFEAEMTAKVEAAQEIIKKGERCRVLMDIIISELGMDYENTSIQVFSKLRDLQNEYEEAVKMMAFIMQKTHNKESVSVSN